MADFQTFIVSKGTTIFAEGSLGDCAYAIESGRVLISLERGGQTVEVAVLGPNEMFGEMAIISSDQRSATATALDDCRLHKIGAEQFSRRLDALDPVMRMVVDMLLLRLRSTLQSYAPGSTPAAPVKRTSTADPCRSEAIDLLRLENEISEAIRNREFVLHYQPVVNLATGKLAGFEGLVRWHHRDRGIVPPDLFVPLAEQSRLISGITRLSLDQVCDHIPQMRIAALQNIENVDPLFVGINVTQDDLKDPSFYQSLEHALVVGGLAASALKLEITETSLMTNVEEVCIHLSRLKALGIRVAIDDFGTGYSSMSYLSRLPISTLKIDKSFIAAMSENEQNRKITSGILKLAHELGVSVIAEGLEFVEDMQYLAANKCDFGQGFYYSKPVMYDDAVKMIENWRAARNPGAQHGDPAAATGDAARS